MNTHELNYFITIADEGNLTKAAEALYVSQPTLTKYLQRLEDKLGLKLFKYAHKTLILTYAGQQYYDYAKSVLKLSKDLQFKLDNITNANEGKIKIGLPPLLSSVILGRILPIYHEEYPGIDVEIIEKNSSDLENALKMGNVDAAIYLESSINKNFASRVLYNEHMNIIFPKEMTLKESYTIEELSSFNILIGYRYQKHAQYIYTLIKDQIRNYNIIEGNNSIAAAILASNGYGVSFLSDTLLNFYNNVYQYNYSRLSNDHPLFLAAYYRKDNHLPAYLLRFLEIAEDVLQTHNNVR